MVRGPIQMSLTGNKIAEQFFFSSQIISSQYLKKLILKY